MFHKTIAVKLNVCCRKAHEETAVGGTPYCFLKAAEKWDWFLKPTAAQTSDLVKRGGVIVMVGNINGETLYRFMDLMYKEGEIRTIYRYRNNFHTAIRAVADGRIMPSIILIRFKGGFMTVSSYCQFRWNNFQKFPVNDICYPIFSRKISHNHKKEGVV